MGIARNIARLVPNGSGLLPNANIEAVAASKLTGSVALASQVSGTLPDANAPSGSVIQVVQTVKSDTFSVASTSFTDVTGLSASITPISASNKILVLVKLTATSTPGAYHGSFGRLLRNGSSIFVGDSSGSRTPMSVYTGVLNDSSGGNHVLTQNISFLDSPNTTSSVTYKMQIADVDNAYTIFVNRSPDDGDSVSNGRAASSIILMEISA